MIREIANPVIEGKPLTRIQEIVWHEDEADRLQEESDNHRWEAAKLITEELATGKSERQLAKEIGKSHVHVNRMRKSWERYPRVTDDRPPFNAVYHSPEVRGSSSASAADELHIPSIEVLADAASADEILYEKLRRALERAAEMVKDQQGDSGQNPRVRHAVKASKLYSKILKSVNQFLEEFKPQPEHHAEAEKVAVALEQAAALIRQRISRQ